MPQLSGIKASLEVGFPNGELPEKFVRYRGRVVRAIDAVSEFPFEDEQFDIVLMDGAAVKRKSVKEAHRVLKPEGRLYFIVYEKKSGGQEGFSLPEIYSIVREGYNIVNVERPAWWTFGLGVRTITICAQKKSWRPHTNTYRPYI